MNLKHLTESQCKAMTTESRETLVIAGAGSGKTKVLCHRIAYLINQGASPADLMVLTFTRRAAGEMLARLEQLLPDVRWSDVLIGTFHSVALNLLNSDGDTLGYTPPITVIELDDCELLLKQCARDLGWFDGKKWRDGLSLKKLRSHLDHYYNTGEWQHGTPELGKLSEICTNYHHELHQMNAVDFGLILIESRRLLTEHPDVLERFRQRIKHVLVDELQDSDTVQYDLHDWFAPPATFFGVGDGGQSIYGFRGARPDLMTERHPGAEIIDLRECFRCGDNIVEAANSLIEHNHDPLAKPMVDTTGGSGRIDIETGRSIDIACVAVSMNRWSYAWSDIAVLARNHRTLRRLEEVFGEHDIPCHRVGSGFDITNTEEFKQLLAALRLCVNARDDLAFLRIYSQFGLSNADYTQLRKQAAEKGASHYLAHDPDWGYRGHQELMETIDENANGYPDEVREFWQEHCSGMTVEEALRWYALRDSQDDLPDEDADEVTLLTVHAAKGLEWPVVLLVGLNEGDLPSSQSLREEGGVEEERRVCYVAVTRAQERVICHYRRIEDQAEGRKVKPPSRFLGESGLMEMANAD